MATAAAVKVELAEETDESEGRLRHSLRLLHGVERSMMSMGDRSP